MYEIEIKSLLGGSKEAEILRKKMLEADPSVKIITENKQLNHYFINGDMDKFIKLTKPLFSKENGDKLEKVIRDGQDFSIRTRQLNKKLFLVVKASIDDTTSANGISRMEFEEEVRGMSLDELDRLLIEAGFEYQAKWSREREEYVCKGANVTIDKNAGYGYLAEFEKVINDNSKADAVIEELRSLMNQLGAEELAQDRLERMFAYYNDNWSEYYGTDKIFIIE
ncbi:hypothetical protein KKH05_02095 [Patescibacteria group bacterium]|nr:hypothetical protein [Patescibacteria group bacterium]